MIMSYNISQYNNTYTTGNSQKIHFEDKLHLPVFQFESKHEEPEHTVINIIGYVDHINHKEQNEQTYDSTDYTSGNVLPLTIHDLNQYQDKKQEKQIIITNFIENLISTNSNNKISNAIFSSLKSFSKIFNDTDVNVTFNEESKLSPYDYENYCDAV